MSALAGSPQGMGSAGRAGDPIKDFGGEAPDLVDDAPGPPRAARTSGKRPQQVQALGFKTRVCLKAV